jgi:hypothetical protein
LDNPIEIIDPLLVAIEAAADGGFFYSIKKVFTAILAAIIGIFLAAILWPAAFYAMQSAQESKDKVGIFGSIIHPTAHMFKYLAVGAFAQAAKGSDNQTMQSLGKAAQAVVFLKLAIAAAFWLLILWLITAPIHLPLGFYNTMVYGGSDYETISKVVQIQETIDSSPQAVVSKVHRTDLKFQELSERGDDGQFKKALEALYFSVTLHNVADISSPRRLVQFVGIHCNIESSKLLSGPIIYRTASVRTDFETLVSSGEVRLGLDIPGDLRLPVQVSQGTELSANVACEVETTASSAVVFQDNGLLNVQTSTTHATLTNLSSKPIVDLEFKCLKNLGEENQNFDVSSYDVISSDKALMSGNEVSLPFDENIPSHAFLECTALDIVTE